MTSTNTPHFCFTFSTTLLTLTTALLIYFNVVVHSVSSSVFLCVKMNLRGEKKVREKRFNQKTKTKHQN